MSKAFTKETETEDADPDLDYALFMAAKAEPKLPHPA